MPNAKEDIKRSMREGIFVSRHSIKRLEGIGSRPYDFGAELRMHSFTADCDTFQQQKSCSS